MKLETYRALKAEKLEMFSAVFYHKLYQITLSKTSVKEIIL